MNTDVARPGQYPDVERRRHVDRTDTTGSIRNRSVRPLAVPATLPDNAPKRPDAAHEDRDLLPSNDLMVLDQHIDDTWAELDTTGVAEQLG